MLAKPSKAFDSDNYLFEVKWDGIRTLAFIEGGSYRLLNRRQRDMTDSYPEFRFFQELPSGTVLDGEVVVLRQGRSHFGRLESREYARSPLKIRCLARTTPATFMAFDLLFEGHRSCLARPLQERRERLARLVRAAKHPQLLLSESITGNGTALFREASARGLEGIVAKRPGSRYQPGKRSGAWIKVKRWETTVCAIIGFEPWGRNNFHSLILASLVDGQLRYVGKVGTGFEGSLRAKLNELLRSRLQSKPLVACKVRGQWVRPGLYCFLSYLERTAGQEFRVPVFMRLLES
jgi:DNA ligase D-like protein (predicted ligase)